MFIHHFWKRSISCQEKEGSRIGVTFTINKFPREKNAKNAILAIAFIWWSSQENTREAKSQHDIIAVKETKNPMRTNSAFSEGKCNFELATGKGTSEGPINKNLESISDSNTCKNQEGGSIWSRPKSFIFYKKLTNFSPPKQLL